MCFLKAIHLYTYFRSIRREIGIGSHKFEKQRLVRSICSELDGPGATLTSSTYVIYFEMCVRHTKNTANNKSVTSRIWEELHTNEEVYVYQQKKVTYRSVFNRWLQAQHRLVQKIELRGYNSSCGCTNNYSFIWTAWYLKRSQVWNFRTKLAYFQTINKTWTRQTIILSNRFKSFPVSETAVANIGCRWIYISTSGSHFSVQLQLPMTWTLVPFHMLLS